MNNIAIYFIIGFCIVWITVCSVEILYRHRGWGL